MKQGWEIKKLGEVCKLLTRGISPKYIEKNGICVLNQKCIRDHQVSLIPSRRHNSTAKLVNPDRYIQIGDILINSTGTGTLGRIAQVRQNPQEPTTVDSHVTIVRPQEGLFYLNFFGYMLMLIEEELKSSGEGCGGQTELSRSALAEKFIVKFPKSLSEQQHIVSILDKAFAAIDKAKANAEQNLKNAKELFESYLQGVFEKKGDGWEEKTLQEVCAKITDGTPQTPKYFDKGVIFLSSKNVTSGKIDWENIKFIDKKQHLEMHKRVAPQVGDILLAKNGTTGVAAIVDREVIFDIYVSLAHIRVLNEVTPEFMLYFINSPVAKKQFNKRLKGSGVPNLHLEEIRQVVISFPKSKKEQQTIVRQLDVLRAETQRLEVIYQKKLNDLEELKKSILQKAFSGELTKDFHAGIIAVKDLCLEGKVMKAEEKLLKSKSKAMA